MPRGGRNSSHRSPWPLRGKVLTGYSYGNGRFENSKYVVGARGLPISIQRAPRCCHKLESRVTRGELVYGARIFTSIYKLRYLLRYYRPAGTLVRDNLIFSESIDRRVASAAAVPPSVSRYLRPREPRYARLHEHPKRRPRLIRSSEARSSGGKLVGLIYDRGGHRRPRPARGTPLPRSSAIERQIEPRVSQRAHPCYLASYRAYRPRRLSRRLYAMLDSAAFYSHRSFSPREPGRRFLLRRSRHANLTIL